MARIPRIIIGSNYKNVWFGVIRAIRSLLVVLVSFVSHPAKKFRGDANV